MLESESLASPHQRKGYTIDRFSFHEAIRFTPAHFTRLTQQDQRIEDMAGIQQ